MKKLLLATNLLLLGIFLIISCSQKTKKLQAVSQPINPCLQQFCTLNPDQGLEGKVEASIIRKMSLDYQADYMKSIINNLCEDAAPYPNDTATTARRASQNDALSVVFDLKKLKALVCLMEQQKCTLNCDTSFELGVRYYYIKYPCELGGVKYRNTGLEGLSSTLRNKHSLVMVPVYRPKNSLYWYDYNVWLKDSCRAKITILGDPELNTFYGLLPGDGDAGDNHGGIGPPPNPGVFPTTEQ